MKSMSKHMGKVTFEETADPEAEASGETAASSEKASPSKG